MKIIKPGRPQTGWSVEALCTGSGNGLGGCGAVLLVEQADVYKTQTHDIEGVVDTFNTFMCPACGVETDLQKTTRVPFDPPAKAAWQRVRDQHNVDYDRPGS